MTCMRDIHEEFAGDLTLLESAYEHGRTGGAMPTDGTADWIDAWRQGRARREREITFGRTKRFQGPNGWYWATENADGFHHQPPSWMMKNS